jgi:hypothetical protein
VPASAQRRVADRQPGEYDWQGGTASRWTQERILATSRSAEAVHAECPGDFDEALGVLTAV